MSRLLDAIEELSRSPAKVRWMAQCSALCTVQQLGRCTVRDVMRLQGLAEFNARRALGDLLAARAIGRVRTREGFVYYLRPRKA